MNPCRIDVATHPPYAVHVGHEVLGDDVGRDLGANAVAVVSDRNVAPLHLEKLGRLARAPLFTIEPGESSKSFAVLEEVLGFLSACDLDRSSAIIALGGGVVGDLAGLAASLYMRGIRWVPCPTTLLAQVDASVGGKTAVNLRAGKNLAGTFHQPAAVFADVEVLSTLPDEELRSGLGEVVKSGLIGDPEILGILETESGAVLARDPDAMQRLVERCIRVKAAVVARDERESGERKVLNLGHTFAHAIELAAGYGRVPHGVAVGVGLVLSVRASASSGILRTPELEGRIIELLGGLGMCAELRELRSRIGQRLPAEELIEALRHDKKGAATKPAWVLLRDTAEPVFDAELEPALLESLLG